MGNNGPLDSERARYARTFNPYQLMENCFFVALARMLSIDSTTVAVWAGEDEMKTANVGIPISSESSFTCLCTKLKSIRATGASQYPECENRLQDEVDQS